MIDGAGAADQSVGRLRVSGKLIICRPALQVRSPDGFFARLIRRSQMIRI